MASKDGIAISIDELKSISKSLQSQKDTIYGTYTSKVVPVLESTRACFKISGLDFSNIESAFKNTFTTLNTNFESLINVLNNNIIAGYSDVSVSIRQMFNQDFASRLNELLNIGNSSIPPISSRIRENDYAK